MPLPPKSLAIATPSSSSYSGQTPFSVPPSMLMGMMGIPRGAGPSVFSTATNVVVPPPSPDELVSESAAAAPPTPTAESAALPTTPDTNRRLPVSAGYLSSSSGILFLVVGVDGAFDSLNEFALVGHRRAVDVVLTDVEVLPLASAFLDDHHVGEELLAVQQHDERQVDEDSRQHAAEEHIGLDEADRQRRADTRRPAREHPGGEQADEADLDDGQEDDADRRGRALARGLVAVDIAVRGAF